MKKTFTILIAAIAAILMMAQPMKAVGQTRTTMTFDFEDSGAHTTDQNAYTTHTYSENGVDISCDKFDCISNSGIGGSYLARGRVAKNTSNTPTLTIGPINVTGWTITSITYYTKGNSDINAVFKTKTNTDSDYVTQISSYSTPTSSTLKTATVSISGKTSLYLQWKGSASSQSTSHRDFDIDDIVITYTTSGGDPIQLSAPSLTAVQSPGKVTLTWDAVSNASSYTIQYADNSSFTGATTVENAISPKEITGLTNGTAYYFKAMSVGNGTTYLSSDYGDAVSATPTAVQLTAPTLTATPGNAKVTLTWSNVSNASSYTIQYADNSSFTGATTVENAISPKEITGLTNGTAYYFKAMSVGDGINYTSSNYGSAVSATPANIATITITQDNLTDFTNSYEWYNWSSGGVSGQAYAYKNSGMQFNSGKDAYWIYNSSAIPGTITSVKMTKASGASDRAWYLRAGTSSITTTSGGTQIGNSSQTVGTDGATWSVSGSYNYFLLYVDGGATVISSIEITYIPSTDPSITAEDVNIAYNATNGSISYTLTNPQTGGAVTAAITAGNTGEWLSIGDPSNSNASGTVALTCGPNAGAERTATVTLTYTYGNSKTQITKPVLVTQLAPPQTYILATSIESGKHYIITNGSTMIMGAQNTNNRVADNVLEDGYYDNVNNKYTIPSDAGIYDFVIIGPDMDGYYTIYDESNKGYLYAASSSANQLKTQNNIDNNARWKITFDGTNKFASIVAEESSNRNVMQYNSGNTLFACYASASQSAIYLYANNNEVTISEDLSISAYDPENGTKSGYYLIAPPVGQVTHIEDNHFLDNNYDLYRFNQSGVNGEWENWKAEGSHQHFNLVSGRGYLYANSDDVTLSFEGYPYVGNGQVFLSYDGTADFAGWNLIGNPWNQSSTVECAYYKMNDAGSELEAATAFVAVEAMQGIFVHADNKGESVTFTKTSKGSAKSNESNVVLNIIDKNNNVIDRAIVCFNEGGTLPKFMLDESNTKIYIPREDDNYAVVSSEGKGTMPINFKANQMGKYTIIVNTEGINMDYLHLIDRITGEDVNLLIDNSYSFIASTQDVESRFILSFTATGYNQDSDEPFAYQNGSEIIVNGSGELQIFDLMGRMVSTQNVNGIETINVKSQGVYILRLNEKTQKIVVR